jgi:hypothetical protein
MVLTPMVTSIVVVYYKNEFYFLPYSVSFVTLITYQVKIHAFFIFKVVYHYFLVCVYWQGFR